MKAEAQTNDLATRATLLWRLKSEDHQSKEIAWTDFHSRYGPVIAGFARKMGAKGGLVDDVVQDVLTGFFQSQPRFVYDPSKGRFRGFLKTVTWRTLSRMRAKHREVSLDDASFAQPQVEEAWHDIWTQEQMRHAVDLTRLKYENNATFRAFEMVALQGKSVDETSKELGISVDSVFQAKRRITAAIRHIVLELEAEEG